METPSTTYDKQSRLLHILLFGGIIATLVYFFGFWQYYGQDRAKSVAQWLWNVAAPDSEHDYGHGRLIPLLIIGLLWIKRKEIAASKGPSSPMGVVIILAGVCLYLLAARTVQARFAAAALPIIVLGTIDFLFGRRTTRICFFPCILVFFGIPLPGLVQATSNLQVFATKAAYWMGTLSGADIAVAGTNITSNSGSWGEGFNIAEGCSGIRSLVALTLIAAVYGHLTMDRLWKKIALLVASVPLAMLANSLRVGTIIVIAEHISPDLAANTYHNWSGFLFFPIALGLLVLFGTILNGGWRSLRPSSTVKTVVRKPAMADGD